MAPILAAPLLTGIRRSTVGPGIREDITDRRACVVGGVRRSCPTSEYIVPAAAVSLLPEDDRQMAALAVIHLFGGLGFSAADLAGGLRDADSRALCSRP